MALKNKNNEELNIYKEAFDILMEYWDSLPDIEKPIIDRKLRDLGL
jgi:hypothetical protein